MTNKSNMLAGYEQFSQECSLFKLHKEMRSKVLDMCVGYVGFFSINGKMYSSSLICADSRGGMLHKLGKSTKGIPVQCRRLGKGNLRSLPILRSVSVSLEIYRFLYRASL